MKLKIFILSFLLVTLLAGLKSQDIHENFYKKFSVGMALAYGPENILSIVPPKLSFYYYDKHKHFETYCGVESSFWMLFGFWASGDVLYGIRKGVFTLDTSLGAWWLPRQSNYYNDIEESSSYFSLNPKLGLRLGWFWFKVGPSFVFGENFRASFDGYDGFYKIGNVPLNIELSVNIPVYFPDYRKIDNWNKTKNISAFFL